MANVPAAGQSGRPEGGERGFAVNGDQRLLQALTTEHFTLQTARSATIMESNGRSALVLSTVSSAVVALAFIGQVADVGQPFFLFALAVLPTLFLLGLLTYLRLAQSASEDLLYSRAINRIRRYYLDLDPGPAGRAVALFPWQQLRSASRPRALNLGPHPDPKIHDERAGGSTRRSAAEPGSKQLDARRLRRRVRG
jgi:hypothetical protein